MHQELDIHTENITKVVGVQFSVLSPEEIRRRSVAEIFTQETVVNGDKMVVGGLFDPRMGVLDHGKKCPTDLHDNRFCPGYFGHIELGLPVFHIHFMKFILQTLKTVCWKCSKLLVSSSQEQVQKILAKNTGLKRMQQISKLCDKVKRCGEKNEDGCGCPCPHTIKKDSSGIGKIIVQWKMGSTARLYWTASDVQKIFRRMSDEDIEILGFNKNFCRPEWMICSVFGYRLRPYDRLFGLTTIAAWRMI